MGQNSLFCPLIEIGSIRGLCDFCNFSKVKNRDFKRENSNIFLSLCLTFSAKIQINFYQNSDFCNFCSKIELLSQCAFMQGSWHISAKFFALFLTVRWRFKRQVISNRYNIFWLSSLINWNPPIGVDYRQKLCQSAQCCGIGRGEPL